MATHMACAIAVTTTQSFTLENVPTDMAMAVAVTTVMSVGAGYTADTTDRGGIAGAGQGTGRDTTGTAGTGGTRTDTGQSHGGGGRGSPDDSTPSTFPALYPADDLYPANDLYPVA